MNREFPRNDQIVATAYLDFDTIQKVYYYNYNGLDDIEVLLFELDGKQSGYCSGDVQRPWNGGKEVLGTFASVGSLLRG